MCFLANVFAICCCPSVCRLSVTFVRPTQPVEIFGNVSTPFGTLALCWHARTIFTDVVPKEPSVGGWEGLNARGVAKYSDFGLIEGFRKRCKIGGKLVLLTNRKSYMSFWLVPKSSRTQKKSPKNRHLGTIAQLCRAVSSQLRHASTIGKNC